MKDINDMTLQELKDMPLFGRTELFREVVIVPMDDIHDSGFRCMKFILMHRGEIVGCVGGWSDVIHPNGIGNYGKEFSSDDVASGKVQKLGLRMDCLKESGCVRLMFDYPCKVNTVLSDFVFYRED